MRKNSSSKTLPIRKKPGLPAYQGFWSRRRRAEGQNRNQILAVAKSTSVRRVQTSSRKTMELEGDVSNKTGVRRQITNFTGSKALKGQGNLYGKNSLCHGSKCQKKCCRHNGAMQLARTQRGGNGGPSGKLWWGGRANPTNRENGYHNRKASSKRVRGAGRQTTWVTGIFWSKRCFLGHPV